MTPRVAGPVAPPLVSRALAVRAACRAAPVVTLLVGLAAGGAGALALALCASFAVTLSATPFVERLAVRRAWRPAAPRRAALEATLGATVLHTVGFVNAALWLAAPGSDLQARAATARVDELPEVALVALIAGWTLAVPSGPLAHWQQALWPRPPGEAVDLAVAAVWATVWSAPVALLFGVACSLNESSSGLSVGDPHLGALGLIAGLAVAALGGVMATVALGLADLLAWRLSPERPEDA